MRTGSDYHLSMNAANAAFRREIQDSFARQGFMHTIGAALSRVEPGEVHIRLALTPALGQQNGFGHAGAIAAIADTACGYAALSVAPPDHDVLAVEFKINLVAPARTPHAEARAVVLRRGRTLTIARADVFGLDGRGESLIATMLETAIVRPRTV
jgi:uncharacterized protein (TIGR00369 family)